MEQELLRLKQEAEEALGQSADAIQLEAFRVKYLGRKGGLLTGVLRQLGKAASEDRPRLGQLANDVKQAVEVRFEEIKDQLTYPQSRDPLTVQLITVCRDDIFRSASCIRSPR